MAQKIQTLFIDDLDGSEAAGTVRFGLDGTEYEIDLRPRTATSSARPWSSTSGTGGGPAARPGALPAADAQMMASIPPRSASGPRGRASRSRTAAGSRPASSSSTRRP